MHERSSALPVVARCWRFRRDPAPVSEWEAELVVYPTGMDLARAQSADEEEEDGAADEEDSPVIRNKTETGTSQRIWKDGGTLRAEYHFINFNRDKLNVSFSMPEAYYKNYLTGYGYTDREFVALKAWHEKAHQAAWKSAYMAGEAGR